MNGFNPHEKPPIRFCNSTVAHCLFSVYTKSSCFSSKTYGHPQYAVPNVAVHRYPVNVTAYAHLRLPAAIGHMLWPHYDTGSRSINGGIDQGMNGNFQTAICTENNFGAQGTNFLLLSYPKLNLFLQEFLCWKTQLSLLLFTSCTFWA